MFGLIVGGGTTSASGSLSGRHTQTQVEARAGVAAAIVAAIIAVPKGGINFFSLNKNSNAGRIEFTHLYATTRGQCGGLRPNRCS